MIGFYIWVLLSKFYMMRSSKCSSRWTIESLVIIKDFPLCNRAPILSETVLELSATMSSIKKKNSLRLPLEWSSSEKMRDRLKFPSINGEFAYLDVTNTILKYNIKVLDIHSIKIFNKTLVPQMVWTTPILSDFIFF